MRSLLGSGLALLVALDVHTTATQTPPLRFVTVTAGADHVCALTDDGNAYCWGSNSVGQLGNGEADSVPHPTPVRVHSDVKFTSLSSGFAHSCALERDGSAWCWGANETAQLGDGTTKNAPTPTPLPVRVNTDVKFKTIGAGGGHTCAVTAHDGSVMCWGDNRHGALGNGSTERALTPTPIAKP